LLLYFRLDQLILIDYRLEPEYVQYDKHQYNDSAGGYCDTLFLQFRQ